MLPSRPLLLSCCAVSLFLGDAASLSLSPAPATAHDNCRHGRGCQRDRIDVGDVIVGIAIIAGIAAIASATKKNDRDDDREDDRGDGNMEAGDDRLAGRAIDACALEAERRAQRQGYDAVVRDIISTEKVSDGYRVRGHIEVVRRFDDDWRDDRWRDYSLARPIRFTCLATLAGRVRELRFNDPALTLR